MDRNRNKMKGGHMARIRTIKPEFWTSEQVVSCSPMARLLFIGLWTFADDAGRHPLSALRTKMEIFPGDDIDGPGILRLIEELSENGLVKVYTVENKEYLQVTGWHHQRIDKPNIRYPGQKFEDRSTTALRLVDDQSTREGRGEGRESSYRNHPTGDSPISPVMTGTLACTKLPSVDIAKRLVGIWNEVLGESARLTKARIPTLNARYREEGEEGWREMCAKVAASPFLRGANDRRWRATLGWVCKAENYAKVIEGAYDGDRNDPNAVGGYRRAMAEGLAPGLAAGRSNTGGGDNSQAPSGSGGAGRLPDDGSPVLGGYRTALQAGRHVRVADSTDSSSATVLASAPGLTGVGGHGDSGEAHQDLEMGEPSSSSGRGEGAGAGSIPQASEIAEERRNGTEPLDQPDRD